MSPIDTYKYFEIGNLISITGMYYFYKKYDQLTKRFFEGMLVECNSTNCLILNITEREFDDYNNKKLIVEYYKMLVNNEICYLSSTDIYLVSNEFIKLIIN